MLLSLAAIALVAALLAVHPFVTYPASLLVLRRWYPPTPPAATPAQPAPARGAVLLRL